MIIVVAGQLCAEQFIADDRQIMETGVAKLGFEEQSVYANGQPRWLWASKYP